MYTVELNDGTTYRGTGVDNTIYINGVQKDSNVDGSGDIAMGDDSYQMFFARGTTRKKWDGTNWNNWSIGKPTGKVTLAAATSVTSTIADFNNSESPAVTVVHGSATIGGAADQAGTANEATTVTPNSEHISTLQRLWTSDQDFYDISGVDGSSTDLIDIYVKFAKPTEVDKVTLVFGVGDSSTIPFAEDKFTFTFNLKQGRAIPLKDAASEGYDAYAEAVIKSVDGVTPQDRTGIQSPAEVKAKIGKVGDDKSPVIGAPTGDVWGHLTVSRGQFKRTGNDTSRGWDTVRGFRVTTHMVKGKSSGVSFSDCTVIGGGDRALTGTLP
jgi:hypothetical protein